MSPVLGIIASGISGHLTPPYDPSSYDALASVTLTGSTNSLTFAGIPSGYKHLQIRYSLTASAPSDTILRFNSDSGANYSAHLFRGTGSAAQAYPYSSQTAAILQYNIGYSTSVAVADILDYNNTNKNKTIRTLAGFDSNSLGELDLWSGSWYNTSAIASVTILTSSAATFSANSIFALYGVK